MRSSNAALVQRVQRVQRVQPQGDLEEPSVQRMFEQPNI